MKMESFARSRRVDMIIAELDAIIEKTSDYFDDELTAQLNITKAYLREALVTIRHHELQRLRLVHEISRLSRTQLNRRRTLKQMPKASP